MAELSILIPARNEEYLHKTLEDVALHAEADTEVIVGLDGWRPGWDTSISWDIQLQFTANSEPIGQRAMTNELARMSSAKYVMKLDAHCSFQRGFDRLLLEKMEEAMVMTPVLCRLDAPKWQILPKPFTKKYYFDTNMAFQYWGGDVPEWGLVETMALQGSCFMVSRENYWKWNLCDEAYGSWGFQGAETACKAWFNGGRVVTNTDVFYGHMFRVENIPYVRTTEEVERARACAQALLKHPKMPWLVEKFGYPGDWTREKVGDICLTRK